MTYTFVFEPEYERIITACIIEARASIPAIKNQVGSVIKSYVDGQVAEVGENSIVYKIETELGVLAGYFVLDVNITNRTAMLSTSVMRPAFKGNSTISTQIVSFVISQNWKQDYLF